MKNKKLIGFGITGSVIIVLALIIASLFFLGFLRQSGVGFKEDLSLYHYGIDSSCIDLPVTWSQSSSVRTFSSDFDFSIIRTERAESTIRDPKIRQSFCSANLYIIEVKKDGNLIDTINPGNLLLRSGGTIEGLECVEINEIVENENKKIIGYADNGIKYEGGLPDGFSGVNVKFSDESWAIACGNTRLVKLKNKLNLVYPSNSMELKLISFEKVENELNIDLRINSNVNGKAEVKLELIPQGLLEIAKTKTQIVDLKKGIAQQVTYTYDIGDKEPSEFLIQPNVKLFISKSGFSGLNGDFYEGSEIKVGEYAVGIIPLEEESKNVELELEEIVEEEEQQDLPQEDEDGFNMLLIIPIGILVIFLILIILLGLKRLIK